MTNNELAKAIEDLSKEVKAIRTSLDELTGVKKFLMSFVITGASIVTAIETWYRIHHK